MSLLPKKTKRMNYRLVGASMPPHIHSYLTLYILAKGIAKTDIIGDLLKDWVKDTEKIDPAENLLEALTNRMQAKWYELKAEKTTMSFDDFKIKVTQELVHKGLLDEYIVEVLNNIQQYETVKRVSTIK